MGCEKLSRNSIFIWRESCEIRVEKRRAGGGGMKQRWLQPPEWSWNVAGEDTPYLILYGAPISRSSISVSGAFLYPLEFRRM